MTLRSSSASPLSWLLCRTGQQLCALPLRYVVETMRPLPIKPLAAAPGLVRGLSLIRGLPVPVVDTALLLDEPAGKAGRLVTIGLGDRLVALLVDQVLGVRTIANDVSDGLPPLLRSAAADLVETIGTLDAELVFFLSTARIAADALVEAADAQGEA